MKFVKCSNEGKMLKVNVIYCSVSEQTDEKISVGFFATQNTEVVFVLLDEKIKLLKGVLEHETFDFLSQELRHYKSMAKYWGKQKDSFSIDIQSIISDATASLNGMITLSDTINFQKDLTNRNIESIQRMLFPIKLQKKRDLKFKKQINDFKRKTKQHLSFDVNTRDHLNLTSLLVPLNIGFVGKNGHIIAGDYLNVNADMNLVGYKIQSILEIFKSIKSDLDNFANYIVIVNSDEDSIYEEYHNILVKRNGIDVVVAKKNPLEAFINDITNSNSLPFPLVN